MYDESAQGVHAGSNCECIIGVDIRRAFDCSPSALNLDPNLWADSGLLEWRGLRCLSTAAHGLWFELSSHALLDGGVVNWF